MIKIKEDLEERVKQFLSGKLWGQSPPMHMGTYHLVNDLWAEIKRVNIADEFCDKMISRIEELMDAQPGTKEMDELKGLSKIVSEYEELRYCDKSCPKCRTHHPVNYCEKCGHTWA